MTSYVLILTLLLSNGQSKTVSHQNFASMELCQKAGETYVSEHAGQQLSYRCFISHPEVSEPNLDENGNPIE